MIFYRRPKPIHAISLDLDDTLYNNHPFMVRAEQALLAFLAQSHPLTQGKDRHYWLSHKNKLLTNRPELASDMSLLRRLTLESGLTALGYRGSELAQGVQAGFDYFYQVRSDFRVADDVCALLGKLADKIPLVAITNGNVNLQQIGIAPYFSHCYKANLHNLKKPHPSMFIQAINELQLSPENILHVGDCLINDVMGANRVGMQTAWYAANRTMALSKETAQSLPDIQLNQLQELATLVL